MRTTILMALAVMIFATPALAQVNRQSPDLADIVFSEIEKRLVQDYYQGGALRAPDAAARIKAAKPKQGAGGNRRQPPGLARRATLPPGLARQLETRSTLPPGLAKRDLPADLTSRLPFPLPGTERVIVDNDVLLIQQATGLILDILEDVILNP